MKETLAGRLESQGAIMINYVKCESTASLPKTRDFKCFGLNRAGSLCTAASGAFFLKFD